MNYNHAVSNENLIKRVPYENVGSGFLKLSHKSMALIVVIWLNSGVFTYAMPYVPNYIRWGLFIAWLGLAVISNKKFVNTFITQCWPLLFFFLYIVAISPFIDGDYVDTYIKSTSYLIMVYSIFLYYFDDKYRRFSKVMITFLFFDCLFVAINTYSKLQTDPLLARYLSTGNAADSFGTADYNGVGSYGYFYALVSIILFLFFLFLNYRKRRLLTLTSIAAFTTVLIEASFTIAILLAFGFMMTIFILRYTNKFTYLFMVLLGVTMIFGFRGAFSSIFSSIAKINGLSSDVSTRFYELSFLFSDSNISGTDLHIRSKLYQQSVDAFLNHPLFGTSVSGSQTHFAGEHSAWMDLLAQFGLLSILFFVFLFKAYNYCKNRVPDKFKSFIAVYWLYFICLGCINTLLFSNIFTIWLLFLPIAINSFLKQRESPPRVRGLPFD